ncbi:hypothetical protein ACFOKF_22135 [Sphingobium rhizovicinum]|uniref:DUF551 domain-containing protein n=1 Tax=Sphingobium rhizovicinum TaxID=432308 RepID=A0ABV7NNE9_9SPHN
MEQYNKTSLETAACLWEAVLNLRDNPITAREDIAVVLEIRAAFEALGTAAVRLVVVGWTDAVEAAWKQQADNYPLCFDWDFVPAWIIDTVDWSDPFTPTLKTRGEE